MRITIKIASSGQTGVAQFPLLRRPIDTCVGPDGRQREDLLRQALNVDGVQFANDENLATAAFSAEFLTQLRSVTEHLKDAQETAQHARSIARGAQRLDHGFNAFVRLDVAFCGDTLRIRLSCGNPKNVVGDTEIFTRRYADLCARVLLHLYEEFAKNGLTHLALVGADGCADVFDRARRANAWFDRRDAAESTNRALEAKRATCPHRVGQYCTLPPTETCACARIGRCEPPTLPPDLQDKPEDIFL